MIYKMYSCDFEDINFNSISSGLTTLNFSRASFFSLRYCDKCNTEILGYWKINGKYSEVSSFITEKNTPEIFRDKKYLSRFFVKPSKEDLQNLASDLEKLIPIKKEYDNFKSMKKCPICGEDLLEKPGYLFDAKCDYLGYPWEIWIDFKNKTILSSFEGILGENAGLNLPHSDYVTEIHLTSLLWQLEKDNKNLDDSIFEKIRNFMSNQRALLYESERRKQSEEKANALCENNIVNNNMLLEIKNEFSLKDYLSHIYILEKNKYALVERLKSLYFILDPLEKDVLSSKKIMLLDVENYIGRLLNKIENLNHIDPTAIPNTAFSENLYKESHHKPVAPENKPVEPILETPKLFNKKKVLQSNAEKMRVFQDEKEKYENSLKQYEIDLEKYNSELQIAKQKDVNYFKQKCENSKKQHEEKLSLLKKEYENALSRKTELLENSNLIEPPANLVYNFWKDEVDETEQLLNKHITTLNKLYSYNVVYEKYRDMVTIATLYEYVLSGRCSSLEGADGAYNIFENEIRMNTIMSQLTQVIDSLEEIKQNQRMTYLALTEVKEQMNSLTRLASEANTELKNISSNTKNIEKTNAIIAENSKVIAYNTERTAYYAKKNAELTKALGFMVALS